jgi:hypothetical protein
MKYIGEMASSDMIYIPSLIEIGTGVQAILRVFSQKFEKL